MFKKKLTQIVSTAYWIAFGPHGPRAQDPPGTGAKVAWGVALGLAASFGLFAVIRLFANPAPYTMTKEYQEQSNEFLIVSRLLLASAVTSQTLTSHLLEPKIRSSHRYHLRRLQGPRYGPVAFWQELKRIHTIFSFVLEAGVAHGDASSMCKMDLDHWCVGGGFRGDSRNSSLLGVNTVLQQRNASHCLRFYCLKFPIFNHLHCPVASCPDVPPLKRPRVICSKTPDISS